jgi:hypothetical protein
VYVSHPVRAIRDDPQSDESVDLVVTVDPDAATDPRTTVRDLGGTVVDELPYDAVRVRVPEPAVASLCDSGGIERIETAETLRVAAVDTDPDPDADDDTGVDSTDGADSGDGAGYDPTTDPADRRE